MSLFVKNLESYLGECLERRIAKTTSRVQCRLLVDIRGNAHKHNILIKLCLVGVYGELVNNMVMLLQVCRETQRVFVAAEKALECVVVGREDLSEQEHPGELVAVVGLGERELALDELDRVREDHGVVVVDCLQGAVFKGWAGVTAFFELGKINQVLNVCNKMSS